MSPLASTGHDGFKTPSRHELVTDDPLRYLNTYKNAKKEKPREFIGSVRKMLHTNLLNEDRERELEEIAERYEIEKEKLAMAREAFEEDLQRFRSMKGEMEQASQSK